MSGISALNESNAGEVLANYPAPLRVGPVTRLGNRGGFSGAALFRIDNAAGPLCLRAWPIRESPSDRLPWLHQLMGAARDRGLSFVPRVLATSAGRTVVRHADRFWELQEWLPGQADFHRQPSAARLENACITLTRLHVVWEIGSVVQPCPAIQRRLQGSRQWHPVAVANAFLQTVVERAERVLPRWLPELDAWLQPWAQRPFRLQPCLCDVWHDHVLFDGERVSGIVDYGAVKVDHAAVDLARMLGSLIEDDDAAWRIGLTAYRSVRAFSHEEERLARVLDVSGAVLGVVNWLQRLGAEKRGDEEAVARRLETLVRRLERWEKQTPLAAKQ